MFSHLTITLLLHYLAKRRSRILAVYSSECSAYASTQKMCDHRTLTRLTNDYTTWVECASGASLSYQHLGRWRTDTTHQQQVGRWVMRLLNLLYASGVSVYALAFVPKADILMWFWD